MPYYFAYGSNMNPRRVAQRGLSVELAMSGQLRDMVLQFNKRSRHNPEWGCANVGHSPGSIVEGVLYRLTDHRQIELMDPFEGTPRYYNRERFPVYTDQGVFPAWVYIANPSVIDNAARPLKWYMGQLLEGRPYLSRDYAAYLEAVVCHADDHQGWG